MNRDKHNPEKALSAATAVAVRGMLWLLRLRLSILRLLWGLPRIALGLQLAGLTTSSHEWVLRMHRWGIPRGSRRGHLVI